MLRQLLERRGLIFDFLRRVEGQPRAAINFSELPDISVTTETLGNNSSVKYERCYTRVVPVTVLVTTCLDKDKRYAWRFRLMQHK